MFRKRWLKTFVAMVALVAMLTESTYSVFASAGGFEGDSSVETVAEEIPAEEVETVAEDSYVEASEEIPVEETQEFIEEEIPAQEEIIAYDSSDEGQVVADEPEQIAQEEIIQNDNTEIVDEQLLNTETQSDELLLEGSLQEEVILSESVEEPVYEEAEELLNGNLYIEDDQISGSGYKEIEVYIDTQNLQIEDRFRVLFTGPDSAVYNPVINDDMDKSNEGYLIFEELNGEGFNIRVQSSENVIITYSYNEDGYPMISLESPVVEKEKILETRDLYATDGKTHAGIYGEGYDSFSLEIIPENLDDNSRFTLYVETAADASVDGRSAANGISLDRNAGVLSIDNLNGEAFTAYVVPDSEDELFTAASIRNYENGEASITVSMVEIEKRLTSSNDGIEGQGFDSIELSMEYIRRTVEGASVDSEDTAEKEHFKYDIFVNTASEEANVIINGVSGRQATLDSTVESVVIEGLDKEAFVIYAVEVKDDTKYEKTEEQKTEIAYAVSSIEDGRAQVSFTYSDAATKTVYEYEDAKVYVRATLEKADAVPDSAYFAVTPVYNTAETLDVLNSNEAGDVEKYNDDNTLIYDIGFYTDESKTEEIEPEDGTVTVFFEFKRDQLTEELGAEQAQEVEILHIEETETGATEITTVEANVSVDGTDVVEFVTDSFSTYVIYVPSGLKPVYSNKLSLSDMLGSEGVHFGIIAQEVDVANHYESNFAAGKVTADWRGDFHTKTGKGSSRPGDFVICDADSNVTSLQIINQVGTKFNVYAPQAVIDSLSTSTGNVSWRLNNQPDSFNLKPTSQEEINGYFGRVWGGAYSASENLAGVVGSDTKDASGLIKATPGNVGELNFDFTSEEAGTYFINTSANDFNSLPERIKMNGNQTLVFNITDTGDVSLNGKAVFVDGNQIAKDSNSLTSNIVINCFASSKTVYLNATNCPVLAVNANVRVTGNSSGWITAKHVYTGPEFHNWHYEPGEITLNTTVGFPAKKFVDNATPSDTYTFKLYSLDNGSWVEKESKSNSGESIQFSDLSFSPDNAGVKWFLIGEEEGTDTGMLYDQTLYLAKVTVSATTTSISEVLTQTAANASVEYYKTNGSDTKEDILSNGSVDTSKLSTISGASEVVFNNTTGGKKGSYQISATKRVERVTSQFSGENVTDYPTPENIFRFKLERLDLSKSTDWVCDNQTWQDLGPAYTVTNNGSSITFPEVEFLSEDRLGYEWGGSNDSSKRVYYYRLTELADPNKGTDDADGYSRDETEYIYQIYVNKSDLQPGQVNVTKREFTYVNGVKTLVASDGSNNGANRWGVAVSDGNCVFTNKTQLCSLEVYKRVFVNGEKATSTRYANDFNKTFYFKLYPVYKDSQGNYYRGSNIVQNGNNGIFSLLPTDKTDSEIDGSGETTRKCRISNLPICEKYDIVECDANGNEVSLRASATTVHTGYSSAIDFEYGSYRYYVKYHAICAALINENKGNYIRIYPRNDSWGAAKVLIENARTTSTEGNINGVKKIVDANNNVLTNKDVSGYTFALTAGTNTAGVTTPMPAVTTATSDQSGNFSFGPITFTKAGNYNYTVTETSTKDGIIKDSTVITVTFTVGEDANGDFTTPVMSVVSNPVGRSSVEFRNRYIPEAPVTIYAKKIFTNDSRAIAAGEFYFALKDEAGNIIDIQSNKDAAGNVEFTPISYGLSDVGTKTYTVTEFEGTPVYTKANGIYTVSSVGNKLPGVTYDTAPRTVTVVVSDDNGFSANVTSIGVSAANPVVVSNNYGAKGGVSFGVSKTVSGEATNETFSFGLWDVTGASNVTRASLTDANRKQTLTGVVNGDTKYFGKIEELTTVGSFKYAVAELIPTGAQASSNNFVLNGITYDGHIKVYEVTTRDKGDGELEVKVDGTVVSEAVVEPFTNSYTITSCNLEIPGTKALRGSIPANAEYTFTFNVAAKAGDTFTAANAELPSDVTATVTNSGNFRFGAIKLKAVGAYNFVVTEAPAGYTDILDAAEVYTYHVETKVTAGQLEIDDTKTVITRTEGTSVTNPASIEFVNRYAKGEATIGVTKSFTYKNTTTQAGNTVFNFGLYTSATETALANALRTVSTTGSETKSFAAIQYDVSQLTKGTDGKYTGTFTYYLREDLPSAATAANNYTVDGIEYDPHVCTVTVSVVYNPADGTFVATPAYDSTGNTFNNYKVLSTGAEVPVGKKITGRNFTDADANQYDVVLINPSGTEIARQTITKTSSFLTLLSGSNLGSATLATAADEFSAPGTFGGYSVKEVNHGASTQNPVEFSDGSTVSIDITLYYVTFDVTLNNGALVAQPRFSSDAEGTQTVAGIVFDNRYTDEGGTTVAATKTLKYGTSGTSSTPADELFDFTLAPLDTNTPASTIVGNAGQKNDASGNIGWSLKYTTEDLGTAASKTFQYVITEDVPTTGVTRVNIAADGKIEESATGTYVMKDGVIYNTGLHNKYLVEVTVSTGDTFTVGTPKYYYYDNDTKGSEITNATSVPFENTYHAEVSVNLKAQKTLTGRNMKLVEIGGSQVGEFAFDLYSENGTLLQTKRTTGTGTTETVEFDALTFDETVFTDSATKVYDADNGIYVRYYYIKEQIPSGAQPDGSGNFVLDGVTYDGSVYDVIVQLTDEHDGTIGKKVFYSKAEGFDDTEKSFFQTIADWASAAIDSFMALIGLDSEEGNAVPFANSYTATAKVQFAAIKRMTGKALTLNDFSFTLSGEDSGFTSLAGQKANLNTTNNTYEVTFPEITYSMDDVREAAHVYTISEDRPDTAVEANDYTVDGVHYDPETYTMNVVVSDNGDGTLGITINGTAYSKNDDGEMVCNPDAVAFENSYSTSETGFVLGGTKTLVGRDLENEEFTFALEGDSYKGTEYAQVTIKNGEGDSVATIEFKFPEITINAAALEAARTAGNYKSETETTSGKKEYYFYYTISEVDSADDTLSSWDQHICYVTVTVTDNGDGTLSSDSVYSGGTTNNNFVNTYTANGGQSFFATKKVKTITGNPVTGGDKEFWFKLTGGNFTEAKYAKAKNGAVAEFADSDAYELEQLDTDASGKYIATDYVYTIEELPINSTEVDYGENAATEYKGYHFSEEVYTVTVTVSPSATNSNELGVGIKSITKTNKGVAATIENATNTLADVVFTNEYEANEFVEITGNKNIRNYSGKTLPSDLTPDMFSFELYEGKNPEYDAKPIKTVNAGSTNGDFKFTGDTEEAANYVSALAFTQDSVADSPYYFTVKETIPGAEAKYKNLEYSENVYEIEISVADNGDGTLDIDKTVTLNAGQEVEGARADVAFNNDYYDDASVPFGAIKTLKNATLDGTIDTTFEFELSTTETIKSIVEEAKKENGKWKKSGSTYTQTVNNDLAEITFDPVKFDLSEARTTPYVFTITEKEKDGNYTYDKSSYSVSVTVSRNSSTGELEWQKSYTKTDGKTGAVSRFTNDNGVTFDNEFTTEGEVIFEGHKDLLGFDNAGKVKRGEYRFVLVDDAANSQIGEDEVVTFGELSLDSPKKFSFEKITYDATDYGKTYNYTVYERKGTVDKVDYDKAKYKITVVLDTLDSDGKIDPKVTVVKTETGKSNISMTGDDPEKNLDFTNSYSDEDEWLPVVTKSVRNMEMTSDYSFTLTETGADFNLTKVDAGAYTQTLSNDAGKVKFSSIKYDQSKLGEHYYVIKENVPAEADQKPGVKYDEAEYHVTVTVAVDSDNNDITVDSEYTKVEKDEEGNETSVEGLSSADFENKFIDDEPYQIAGDKILVGRDLAVNEFTFVLKPEQGRKIRKEDGTLVELLTANNAAATAEATENTDGVLVAQSGFEFDKMLFTQDDLVNGVATDYTYSVYEIKSTDEHINSAEKIYTVVLTVDKKDGAITVDQKSLSATTADATIEAKKCLDNIIKAEDGKIYFVNEYEAVGYWDPEGTKEMIGRKLQNGEFSFKLTEVDVEKFGSLKGKTIKPSEVEKYKLGDNEQIAHNKGNNFKFSSDDADFLVYHADTIGHHEYLISEGQDSTENGVEYSDNVYWVPVDVVDENHDGTLTVNSDLSAVYPAITEELRKKYQLDASTMFLFENRFSADGYIDLVGTKNMVGRDLTKDDIFSFTITDKTEGNTNEPVTVNNTNDEFSKPSVVSFDHSKVEFLNYGEDDLGLHTYEIAEVQSTGIPNVICDSVKYTVNVMVAYNDLSGNVVLKENVTDYSKLSKNLKAYVTSVTMNSSEYNGQPYAFVDEENGKNHFEFNNRFSASVSENIAGKKFLENSDGNAITTASLLDGEYSFRLYKYNDEARTDGKTLLDIQSCDASGNFKFDLPEYTQEDLRNPQAKNGDPIYLPYRDFYYKVSEVLPNSGTMTEGNTVFESGGIVFDNAEYDVTVRVTRAEDGTLSAGKITSVTRTTDGVKTTQEYTGSTIDFTNVTKRDEPVTIYGNKYWIDNLDAASRPTVVVRLFSSEVGTEAGQEIAVTEIVAPNYRYSFTKDKDGKDLPRYNKYGQAIVYTVKEDPIPGYASVQSGYDFTNTAGDITIVKLDARTGEPVVGAELGIFESSSATTALETWTSEKAAHAIKANLTKGREYILREITAPAGYSKAADQSFTVPADGKSITVTMLDEPVFGSVRLIKRDADTRETLAGAEFALYNYNGVRMYARGSAGNYTYSSATSNGVFETDSRGELNITGLPYGSYFFRELTAPSGYEITGENVTFTIDSPNEVEEVTCLNTKGSGSVRLIKVNSAGTRRLSGAVFELYAATPRTAGQIAASALFSDAYYLYGTYRTNAAGEIYVDDLPWDSYYFIEVDAPSGYITNTDVNGDDIVYPFTINATTTTTIPLGYITNSTPETPPPYYPPTPPSYTPPTYTPPTYTPPSYTPPTYTPPTYTPPTYTPPTTTTTPPTTTRPASGVAGARVSPGGVVSGVLGVRAAPSSGVLGERVGPVTGDYSNIALWLLILIASISTVVVMLVQSRKMKNAKSR